MHTLSSVVDQTMGQVVAYKSLKAMETLERSLQRSGRSRLQEVVVYKRSQIQGSKWKNLGVLDGLALMGGGRIGDWIVP